MNQIQKPRPKHNKHPVCDNCNSAAVEYRELHSWNSETEEWEAFDASFYCMDCEGDEIKWKRNKASSTASNPELVSA